MKTKTFAPFWISMIMILLLLSSSGTPEQAIQWQKELRAKLFTLMKLDPLLKKRIPFKPKEISSTPGRRIPAFCLLWKSTCTLIENRKSKNKLPSPVIPILIASARERG